MLKLWFSFWLTVNFVLSGCGTSKIIDVEALEEQKLKSYIQNFLSMTNDWNKTSNGKLPSTVMESAETKCLMQVSHFLEELSTFELWSMRMLDSWGKIQSGILTGNLVNFGDYDQCLRLNEIIDDKLIYTIRGKYCMVFYHALPQGNADAILEVLEEEKQNASKESQIKRINLQFGSGFCLPDSCTAEFIKEFANLFLNEFGFQVATGYNQDIYCSSSNEKIVFLMRDKLAILFFAIIFILLLCSTIYDLRMRQKMGNRNELFTAFSVYSNLIDIFQVSEKPASVQGERLDCLNGLRSMSLVWIVLGHRYAHSLILPITNLTYLPLWLEKWYSPIITAAPMAVDTFFVVSGLLITRSMLIDLDQNKKINILCLYFHRFIRLAPALGALILFLISIMKLIGSGPYYKFVIDTLAQDCINYWWSALLFTQNYVNPNNICIVQSWYLSIDMQMLLLSPFLIYGLWKWGRKFVILVSILVITSVIYLLSVSLFYGFVVFPPLRQDLEPLFNRLVYYPTHARMGSWLIGSLLGYALFYWKRMTVKIPKRVVNLSWLLTICTLCTIVFSIHPLQQMNVVQTSKWKSATYISLVRSTWSITIGWIIFLCSNGYGGCINTFLSLNLWKPICKLSYCIYLIHVLVQIYLIAQQRTPGYFMELDFLHSIWGDLVFTIILSLIWSLSFEQPIRNVERYMSGLRWTENISSLRCIAMDVLAALFKNLTEYFMIIQKLDIHEAINHSSIETSVYPIIFN